MDMKKLYAVLLTLCMLASVCCVSQQPYRAHKLTTGKQQ